jgi:hypothetical protein
MIAPIRVLHMYLERLTKRGRGLQLVLVAELQSGKRYELHRAFVDPRATVPCQVSLDPFLVIDGIEKAELSAPGWLPEEVELCQAVFQRIHDVPRVTYNCTLPRGHAGEHRDENREYSAGGAK